MAADMVAVFSMIKLIAQGSDRKGGDDADAAKAGRCISLPIGTHGGCLFIVADVILLRKGKEGMSWHGCSRALCVATERPRGNCCGSALASRPFSAVARAWRGRRLSSYSPSRLGSTPSLQWPWRGVGGG